MTEGGRPTRILIADDHPIFRDGLRKLLEVEPDFAVVGQASNGVEAVSLAGQVRPDILLLDLAMPTRDGLMALSDLASVAPEVRTIVLTAAIDKSQIAEAIRLGAWGVVLKTSPTALLLKGIRRVMAGEYWIGRDSVGELVRYVQVNPSRPTPRRVEAPYGLTPASWRSSASSPRAPQTRRSRTISR